MNNNHEDKPLPLKGVRVLDFGRYIAGPYCAALLADFGADVIRIEKRTGSEDRFVTPVYDDDGGALFLQMNRNKRCMAFNPTSESGKEIVRRLVATSDIVVANLPNWALEKMGLSYPQLRETKPDIILTTVSAFGDDGEWADRVGFDSVAQAMSGAAYMSGDDTPSRSQAPWVDFSTALHCAFGTVLALLSRKQTGDGQQVSASLLGSALTIMNSALLEQHVNAPNRKPLGNDSATASPIGMFKTADGWVSCHVVGQTIFSRLARLIGRDDWISDPRFASDTKRGENQELILTPLRAWCADRSTEQVMNEFASAQIPAGPVLSPQQALDHPATNALDLLKPMAYEGYDKKAPIAASPVKLSATSTKLDSTPKLGAQTDDILRSLGYDDSSIDQLRQDGTI